MVWNTISVPAPLFSPSWRAILGSVLVTGQEATMDFTALVSFDSILLTILACYILRETMIATLPDHVAGPGGWLVDTGRDNV